MFSLCVKAHNNPSDQTKHMALIFLDMVVAEFLVVRVHPFPLVAEFLVVLVLKNKCSYVVYL